MTKKIAFQGFPGAYSDMACRAACPDREALPCKSFEEAFRAVREGAADLAMIPVDNTLAGRVADVHRLLGEGGLFVIAEHFQPVRHALLGVPGARIEDLRHVHSHVHALPQCRKLVERLGLTPHVHADTAGAAAEISRLGDRTQAAIASLLAAEIYGLSVLAEDVQDEKDNTTRFLIFSRNRETPPDGAGLSFMTSFLFRVRNIPAALYKALGGFATNGVNMVKIESYVDGRFQSARFYAEAEGHADSPAVKRAMEELAFFSEDVRILGTYAAHPFRHMQKGKT